MPKLNPLVISAAVVLTTSFAMAEGTAKRDLVTRLYNIQCSGDGVNFEMGWDSAVTPLGPNKIVIAGKAVPVGGMQMSFENGNSTYEVQDLKVTLNDADQDKKSFETVARYNNKDVKVTCTNDKSTKFFRKRKSENETDHKEAKTTRDLLTKISEINCAGDGHDVEMTWDSAVSPMGPATVVLDGRDLPLGGMTMAVEKGASIYQIKGLKLKLNSADKGKKSFTPEAEYNGKSISLRCTNTDRTKFLRKRTVETPASSGEGAAGER